ncbi:MAG: hypothetical protein KG029_01570 [Bacteroidetes bacterium]|jgi:hypothetical protein|nr:hypothetical protein [Bacteroidota bacterium]
MKFIMFRALKPRQYKYKPRYFNPDKEAMERRKAALGVEAKLTDQEELRMRMSSRWRQKNPVEFGEKYKRLSFIIYGSIILLGIYVVFFTDLIDNLIRAFGIVK